MNLSPLHARSALALLLALALSASPSVAQDKATPPPADQPAKDSTPKDSTPKDSTPKTRPGRDKTPSNPTQPADKPPASMAPPASPPSNQSPYIRQERPHNWTLTATVNIRAWTERDKQNMPVTELFDFDTAAVVFPVLMSSGSHRLADLGGVKSQVTFDDRPATESYTPLPPKHSGAIFGRWDLKEKKGRELKLTVSIPVTSFRTVFDEAAASNVSWPKGPWTDPAAASTFEPQEYVDFGPDEKGVMAPYDMEVVDRLLKRWTNNGNPKAIKPVPLAKWLAGMVMEHVQVSGNGLAFNRLGQLEGIDLQGAARTAERGRGSEFDAVCLLAAVYRRAGLPARIVIGYQAQGVDDKEFLGKKEKERLRAWVEFALYDEATASQGWVPVDIVQMRKKHSTLPKSFMERPLPYFGTHEELDLVIPFAFHFFPPTTVRSYGSPAFWGWFVTPAPATRALQAVEFSAITTPIRGGDPSPGESQDSGSPRRPSRGRN